MLSFPHRKSQWYQLTESLSSETIDNILRQLYSSIYLILGSKYTYESKKQRPTEKLLKGNRCNHPSHSFSNSPLAPAPGPELTPNQHKEKSSWVWVQTSDDWCHSSKIERDTRGRERERGEWLHIGGVLEDLVGGQVSRGLPLDASDHLGVDGNDALPAEDRWGDTKSGEKRLRTRVGSLQLYIMVALSTSSVCTEAVEAFTRIQLRSMPPRRSAAAALLEFRNVEDALSRRSTNRVGSFFLELKSSRIREGPGAGSRCWDGCYAPSVDRDRIWGKSNLGFVTRKYIRNICLY